MGNKMEEIETPSPIRWSTIDKGKYLIKYEIIPNYYLAKIKSKTMIPGVNRCQESELYYFKNFEEIENFFEQLIG